MTGRVYLAGPDVFFPNAAAIMERKKAICAQLGIVGLSPLDNEVEVDPNDPPAAPRLIYSGNVEQMLSANAIIANLTPFRGVSADVGTAFELGYCAARGLPLFGYSETKDPYVERVRGAFGLSPDAGSDADGLSIEDMGHADNLMLIESIRHSGGRFFSPHNHPELFGELELFSHCARAAADWMAKGRRLTG